MDFIFPNNAPSGSVPISGPGKRLMYHSFKSAFRVGEVDGTQWDDANIGENSFASGFNPIASGESSSCLGFADSGGKLQSSSFGSLVNGFAILLGEIDASGRGSYAGGYVQDVNSKINSLGYGTHTHGYARSGGKLQNSSFGTTVMGCVFDFAEINASLPGGHASGYAQQKNSKIISVGYGAHTHGYVESGGKLESSSYGTIVTGFSISSAEIKASFPGSHASGYAQDFNSKIISSGYGSHARGNVELGGKLQATSFGTNVTGFATSLGEINATNTGSHASGYAEGSGSKINSTGRGSFCFGFVKGQNKLAENNSNSGEGALVC